MSKINYESLTEITVKNQEELDLIPLDFKGRIYVEFGTYYNPAIVRNNYYYRVEACGNSSVIAWDNSSVEAWENSSVVARDNSSVVARDNSSVVARGNNSVIAWDNSSVEACDNSSVEAWENSSVEAWDNSSVEARDNSSVVARDNSSVVARGNNSVIAWDNSSVEACDNSSVEAWENSSVEAWDNSSVEAKGNSSVVARGNNSVIAWDNSSVEAWENSSVVARDNSSVEAWENSSVEAWDNSSVEAKENSSVEARGNSSVVASSNVQVVDCLQGAKIQISGNARIVYNPKTIHEFMDFYGIKHNKKTAIFYKAVHKKDDILYSDYDKNFQYKIGEIVKENCDSNVARDCSFGIHICHLNWALNYGRNWDDIAILEVEVDIDNIVLPKFSNGKVRTPICRIVREVPLEECGLFGKILSKKISK